MIETRTVPLDKLFAQPDLPPAVAAMLPDSYENVYIFRGLRLLGAGELAHARREFAGALRVSANPSRAALRVGFFLLATTISRSALGLRLVVGLTHLLRRWRRA